MLAENMQELRLAGERFVKVEDWQNDQVIPKYVDIPAGARVYQDDIAKYCKTTKFYKAKKVVGMDKWEKTTDPNYNEKDLSRNGVPTYAENAIFVALRSYALSGSRTKPSGIKFSNFKSPVYFSFLGFRLQKVSKAEILIFCN